MAHGVLQKGKIYRISTFNDVLCVRDVHRNPEGLLHEKRGVVKDSH